MNSCTADPMTFKSEDDAIAWVSARRAEIEMEVWAPDAAARGAMQRSAPTFGAYATAWLEGRKTKGRELRPTTRYHYQQVLDIYINPTFGEKRIDRITVDDVNNWYDELAPGKETVRAQAYSLLRTILTTAASTQPKPLIPFNPAHIRGAGNVQRVHKVRPASLEELEMIVAEMPDRYRLMALLAAWCAMRFGELAELRRGDIDLRDKRVKIRRGVVRVGGEFIVGPPKTDAGIRDVAIPPHLIPAVEAHLRRSRSRSTTLCSSPGQRAGRTWPRRRSTRSSTRRARPPAAKTSAGTTSATPAPSSPPRPAPPWPSSWAASATRRLALPCATSTLRPIGTPRSPGDSRSLRNADPKSDLGLRGAILSPGFRERGGEVVRPLADRERLATGGPVIVARDAEGGGEPALAGVHPLQEVGVVLRRRVGHAEMRNQ